MTLWWKALEKKKNSFCTVHLKSMYKGLNEQALLRTMTVMYRCSKNNTLQSFNVWTILTRSVAKMSRFLGLYASAQLIFLGIRIKYLILAEWAVGGVWCSVVFSSASKHLFIWVRRLRLPLSTLEKSETVYSVQKVFRGRSISPLRLSSFVRTCYDLERDCSQCGNTGTCIAYRMWGPHNNSKNMMKTFTAWIRSCPYHPPIKWPGNYFRSPAEL